MENNHLVLVATSLGESLEEAVAFYVGLLHESRRTKILAHDRFEMNGEQYSATREGGEWKFYRHSMPPVIQPRYLAFEKEKEID